MTARLCSEFIHHRIISSKIYKLSSKVKIDEKTYKSENYKDVAAAFPGNTKLSGNSISIERQVIRYHIDKDGNIDKIDTRNVGSGEDKNTTLNRTTNGAEGLVYTSAIRRLGMSANINATATNIMTVPAINGNGEIVVNGNTIGAAVVLAR